MELSIFNHLVLVKSRFHKQKIDHIVFRDFVFQVTKSGEPVLDLASTDKKSYETLILGYTGDAEQLKSLAGTTKIICSVIKPSLSFSFAPFPSRFQH